MYLPWLGYFGMIDQADVFVFYDDVQFSRDSWQQRNRIKVPEASGQTEWLKVPVIEDFGQDIRSVRIDQARDWQQEHLSTIKSAYGPKSVPYGSASAPYFDDYIHLLNDIYNEDWKSLRDLNIHLIKKLYEELSIDDVEFCLSSDFDIDSSGTDKLIKTLQHINADEYISGPGAKDYLNVNQFVENGISLYWHEFDHPRYNQLYGDFVSHLSIIDALFNVGDELTSLIRTGEENALLQEA
ncbi:WbqC family protein [Natrinema marinum]|uniref:WbqC family protein n=1 Tax=Natrinema marinum TaxID=2961598 RepID=UPI002111C75A|nr:WbqC family protein [Natrinema marinum]